jgi:ubiquinol-cytochrome c reductase cytochrome b subunit
VALGAIYIPTALMLVVFAMPFIGRTWLGHQFNRAFLVVMLAGVSYLTGLTIMEDKENADHQAKLRFAERDAHRVVQLAKREGIPQTGARDLMAHDPFTQGPRLFRRHCAVCHRFDGHDGTFLLIMKRVEDNGVKKSVPEPETAADLHDFGSREWITRVLTDYATTFKALENAGEKGKRFLEGDMANWCNENKKVLTDPANAESLKALVEFIVAQSGRTDLAPYDDKLVAEGKEIFKGGALKSGSLSSNCTDCHAMKAVGDADALSGGAGAGYPKLTGYAGAEWLREFIRNPAHADFYDTNNAMMSFSDKTLSEVDLHLLVNWMVKEYYEPKGH